MIFRYFSETFQKLQKLGYKIFYLQKQNNNDEEDNILRTKVPDYFIFISCQHGDYEIISNPKQSMLEFKNCNQIIKLLQKLLQFYNGDICLTKKTIVQKPVDKEKGKINDKNTRNEVKIIMEKILGSHQKIINGSQLHNGVKGYSSHCLPYVI